MDEKLRNEIVQRWQAQTAQRQIARELGLARSSKAFFQFRLNQNKELVQTEQW